MNKSETIAELAAALAKAQGGTAAAAKDKANPFFKSKYADLASVWEACREPLSKNGLSVVQLPSFADGVVTVETCLLHASGQWISTSLSAPVKENTAQAVGSATTYLRRYSLASMAGVAPDDDDDGNGASAKRDESRTRAEEAAAAQDPKEDSKQALCNKLKTRLLAAKDGEDLAIVQADYTEFAAKKEITAAQAGWLDGILKKQLERIGGGK